MLEILSRSGSVASYRVGTGPPIQISHAAQHGLSARVPPAFVFANISPNLAYPRFAFPWLCLKKGLNPKRHLFLFSRGAAWVTPAICVYFLTYTSVGIEAESEFCHRVVNLKHLFAAACFQNFISLSHVSSVCRFYFLFSFLFSNSELPWLLQLPLNGNFDNQVAHLSCLIKSY